MNEYLDQEGLDLYDSLLKAELSAMGDDVDDLKSQINTFKYGAYQYLAGIKSVPDNLLNVFSCVKYINFTVPDSIKDNEFRLYTFGYNTTYNRFYLQLYDVTNAREDAYAWKQYESRPTSGIENIHFPNVSGKKVSGGNYEYIVTIDWSLYQTSFFYEGNRLTSPIVNVNTALDNPYGYISSYAAPAVDNFLPSATLLTGEFTLSSKVYMQSGQHLRGNKCKITCTDNAQIVMRDNTSIEGIEFVGSWSPTRTHGDGTTYTSYGWVPLVSMEDLSAGSYDTICGEDKGPDDALIMTPTSLSCNARIDGCTFSGFKRPVINASGQAHTEINNPEVVNNYFYNCWLCVYVDAQFTRLSNNVYSSCVIGADLVKGNSIQTNEFYKCCDCGVYYPASNGAHNVISAVQFAHCGLAGIYAKNIESSVGAQVVDCHLADAPIIGETVNNLLINGCRLDAYFKYTTGQHNSIMCSNVGKSYLYGNSLYDVPADTQIVLNRGLGSVPDSDVNVT